VAVDPASNYLGHLVDDIQKTVKHKAQVNMERLQDDCSQLSVAIDKCAACTGGARGL